MPDNERLSFENGWIRDKINKETIKWAKQFVDQLIDKYPDGVVNKKKSMTTTQIRKFFGQIKKIQALGYENTQSELLMLTPKLAYAAGRQKKGHKLHDFYEQMSTILDLIETKEHFENFVKIFEAIVAYHKAAGGE